MYVLGILVILLLGTFALLNIPYIQQKTTVLIADELSTLLGTQVSIGRVNAGFLNRIIVDDMVVEDQSGAEMIRVSRLSAKFEIMPLFQKRISIGSVQLFGFNINLNKPTGDSEANCKFIFDALASKDTLKQSSNIDLRINSVLIRRGRLSYDVLSEEETPGKFNPRHVKLYNIIGNISLKALQSDSINAQIKRFSVDEQSGLELRKLSLKVLGNNTDMAIENFEIGLPGTSLKMDTIRMQYDSLESFNEFTTDVRFSFRMLPSYVTLQDISPFVPILANFKERIDLELDANGTIDRLNCPRLIVNAGNHLRMRGNVELQDLSNPTDAFIYGNLSNLTINREGVDFLTRNFSENYTTTPLLLQNLGNISFSGNITGYFTDLVTYGSLHTELGTVKGDVKLSSDRDKGIFSYSGGVETEGFQLGNWLSDNKLGDVSFKLDIESNHTRNRYPQGLMKGVVAAIDYSGYNYENITLDGEFKDGGFDGAITLDDENLGAFITGKINLTGKTPVFNFYADIQQFRPHDLKLSDKYEDAEFSLKLDANFTGGSIDDMVGTINIGDASFTAPDKSFYIDSINVRATHAAEKKTLSLNSEFINAKIEGNYSYRTLPNSVIGILSQYIPSIIRIDDSKRVNTNDFTFDINIFNTEILPIVFDIPLSIYNQSTIKGYFSDANNRLKLEGYFPRLRYGNTFIESGMILCDNSSDKLRGKVRLMNHRKSGVISLSLDAEADNDQLMTRIDWGNNSAVTYSGHFEALTSFLQNEENSKTLKTVIDIKPTNVILNDTIWKIHPSQIVVDKGNVHVDNFLFSGEDQFLLIDGYASDDIRNTLKVELKDVNIGYVFDIFNLRSVDFKGLASGTALVNRAFDKPVMNTNLSVKNFHFNDALLGDMEVYGEWDDEEQGIFLRARIKEGNISDNSVKGYIYPVKPKSGIDLNITANNANLGFMHEYMDAISSDITGRVSGKIHFYGPFKELNIEGAAKPNASFKVDVLNTYFSLNDSVHLFKEEVSFRNVRVSDSEGHSGTVNGYLRHKNFRDMNYRFAINAANMLVMDTEEDPDMPFYGRIYGTGNVLLTGDSESLNVDAAVTTNRNTNFVYTLASSASAVSNQFITFVDKTPSRSFEDSIQLYSDFELAQQLKRQEEEGGETDIRMNIQIDATPDATVRIIMDPASGDYISGTGSGNIRAEYYNKGDVKMFGSYVINQGIYKFSLQQVIRKDFVISEGSSIMFNGNPLDAVLDIQAIYTVNSASLNDLLPDNQEIVRRTNVRVNSLMNLTGSLLRPTIKLGLELPNEREEIQDLVRNYVSTEEEINMQILYLLGIGKFYTPENTGSSQNSNMMTSVLSSTLSGQLNNMFSQILDNNNWNFGTNVSTGERGWTDVEIEGILSAQLLNNRLIINGNFGYRDNPLSNTNFVGDFDAQWLLTPSGDLRLKAYNQTNDRIYTRSNLTTQGIGIMYKKDFDRWNELFFWNNWRINRKRKAELKQQEEEVETEETIR